MSRVQSGFDCYPQDDGGAAAHQAELDHQLLIEDCIRRLERALQDWQQTRDYQAMGLLD